MTILDKMFPRATPEQPQAAAPPPAPTATTPAAPSEPAAAPESAAGALEARRHTLARELADRQWDLGGMTYEMAIRDHFRLDVLVMHAARLQQLDAELAEVDRQLRLGAAAAAGECPACGATYSRGAGFCWSCGTALTE